jgi:cysteine-rich repeat protein
VWSEIWGDGKRLASFGWDDGNLLNGDGWSSGWTVETGFTCSGGSASKRDTCNEIWGDGINIGFSEWDDHNTADGDGCNSIWEYEKWYAWVGGSPSSSDTCSILHITPTFGQIGKDNSLEVNFSHPMHMTSITLNDISMNIESDVRVTFSWTASYTSSTSMLIRLNIGTALQGGENLTIKFTNSRVIRGENGGWVQPESYSTALESSLGSQSASSSIISQYMQYFVIAGMLGIFGLLLILGSSLELIWSLINTLQIISYLPFMIPYYPEHVKIMFQILSFVNLDIEFLSDLVKDYISIEGLNTNIYNARFIDNGIESPLFLENWASLILSLLLSFFSLLILVWAYVLIRWEKIKEWISPIIMSYFFWNFLRFFTEGYLEISFGAALNVASFSTNSVIEAISLALSILGVLLCILFPLMSFALLYDKREAIKNGHSAYLQRFGTMYRDFKTDKEWYLIQYYPMFLFRRLIFVAFLIVWVNYPEVQCNSFIFFSWIVSLSHKIDVCIPSFCQAIQPRHPELAMIAERRNSLHNCVNPDDFHHRHPAGECGHLDWVDDDRTHYHHDLRQLRSCDILRNLHEVQI